MSFLVEDGTGLAGATSYGSVTEFVLYWADRGKDYSDTDAELIVAALINATDYMEVRFGSKFKGRKVSGEQGLAWPRRYVTDREGYEIAYDAVPSRIKRACFEYAKRALDADLLPDPSGDPNVISETKTVGPITTSKTYAGSATGTKVKPYPMADALVNELTIPESGSFR